MPLPTKTKSTKWDLIRADMQADLEGIDGSATGSSAVDAQSASGQAVLKVASTTGFVTNSTVIIDPGETDEEVHSVLSIASGDSLTLDGNLANTHEVGVVVKQDWYNFDVDRVEFVDSAEKLGPPVGGPWPMINIFCGPEMFVEALTGYDTNTRNIHIAAWHPVKEEWPADDDNECYYQMLVADIRKAFLEDWTRGGHAMATRITEARRIIPDEVPPPGEDFRQGLPMVGAYVVAEIDYTEKRGNSYA